MLILLLGSAMAVDLAQLLKRLDVRKCRTMVAIFVLHYIFSIVVVIVDQIPPIISAANAHGFVDVI